MSIADADRQDKILKLLRKAESTDSPAEAELLTAKATELMVQYGIDQARIDAARLGTDVKKEKIITVSVPVSGIFLKAHRVLASRMAQGLGTVQTYTALGVKKNQASVVFVGFESDVKQAETLFLSLLLQSAAAMNVWWKDFTWSDAMTAMERFKERRDFLFGYAAGVEKRLTVVRETAVKAADTTTPGTALVLVDRRTQVDRYYEDLSATLGLKTSANRASMGTGSGRRDGYAEGLKANTGERGVGSNSKSLT